jgi:hypothetical protein
VFALIWLDAVLDELAGLYVAAKLPDRARMAAAVEALNSRLRSDASAEGESREGNLRITFIPLLAVTFHVSEPDRVVHVIGIQKFGR